MIKQTNEIPHFIFLDINMPKTDGLECLLQVKANPKFNSSILIIYSTSDNKRDIDKSFERKANMYLIKPYSEVLLRKALQKILTKSWNEPLPPSDFTLNVESLY